MHVRFHMLSASSILCEAPFCATTAGWMLSTSAHCLGARAVQVVAVRPCTPQCFNQCMLQRHVHRMPCPQCDALLLLAAYVCVG